MAAMAMVGSTPVKAAPDVTITVTIIRFTEVQDPDPAPFQGVGDYYARVKIGANAFQDTESQHQDDVPDIRPHWTFSRTVDASLGSAPIVIQIWDDDVGLAAPDDIIDLNPIDGVQELTLTVNPLTGTWSDGATANIRFSQGDGDHEDFGLTEGGEAGKIYFDIAVGSDGDLDDDGIPDGVERFGVLDGNGNLVADMPAMGADPCRKTIAIEIDFMEGAADGHTHRPLPAAIAEVIAAGNAAPVAAASPCPYAGFPSQPGGVNFVLDVSTAIPEAAVFALGPEFDAARNANFNGDRRPYFHYMIFVHDQAAGSSSSGLCCNGNKDFIVSLGSWANQVGTFRDQSGSILHELGHSLGLAHGGDEGTNYKANYLSVMNYRFDPGGIPDPTIPSNNVDSNGDGLLDTKARLDYSRSKLPDLNETTLNESSGISDATDVTSWSDLAANGQAGAGNGALNWTGNDFNSDGNPTNDSGVTVDINNDGLCVNAGMNGTLDTAPAGDDVVSGTNIRSGSNRTCNTTAAGDDGQVLPSGTAQPNTHTGFDDWANIKYRAAMSVNAGGPAITHGPDVTYQEALANRAVLALLLSPDLKTAKTVDKLNAEPGDTLNYSVKVDNIGTGTATAVKLDDTLPDSTAAPTRTLADLLVGGTTTEAYSYLVPCATSDQTVLTNSATVKAKNLILNPESNTSNNSASATTTIHTPVLALSKTASASVAAGEAITYRLTYANTGSGGAASVVITDVLAADVYYSKALDLGAGPQPNSVVVNGDGTTTLTWNVGAVPASSGPIVIEFTARPSLLALGGANFPNNASLTFQNANGCVYAPVNATASTTITVVAPTRDPVGVGFLRNHEELLLAEILARIQATDQRFDGADGTAPNGALSVAEVTAVLVPGGNMNKVLAEQLIATYFNLATRRINAGTAIDSRLAGQLGLANVRDAVIYAEATLLLPVISANRPQYSDATTVLEQINANRIEVY